MELINQKSGPKLLIDSNSTKMNPIPPDRAKSQKFQSTYALSVAMLVLAGIIWGFSFTAVKWGLLDFSTTQLLFWRLLLAFVVGELFLFLLFRKEWFGSRPDIRLSLKPGFFLGLSLLFQIHGLNYTTATNSGFITSLYVVLIPFISFVFYKHKIRSVHYLLALAAFIGMGFLLGLLPPSIQTLTSGFTSGLNLSMSFGQSLWGKFNTGDLLTLGAALTAAFQIIEIGQTAPLARSAFRYNIYQTFWCLLTTVPFFIYESLTSKKGFWPQTTSLYSLSGLLILALVVSLFAFYLQVRAQKNLSTTTASMLCLLEAPFSFAFAALLMPAALAGFQIFGAVLILASSAFSVFVDRPQNRSN